MNGVIYAIKPPGMTSSNLVVAIKKILDIKKVGHSGTLDPGACGVMGVCIGRATKIADYMMEGQKVYIAEMRFGVATDTLDSYGKTTSFCNKRISLRMLRDAVQRFTGEIEQIPPMYSAIKVNGQKMYHLARQGKEIALPARRVTVHSIEILEYREAQNTGLLKIVCSKGTYVRTLCQDIAETMGTVACMTFLIRTKSCNASLSEAYTLDEIRRMTKEADYSFILNTDEALFHLNKVVLEDYLFPIITTGSPIDLKKVKNRAEIPQNENLLVYCAGRFIGIGRATEDTLKMQNMIYIEERDA